MIYLGSIVCAAATSKNNATTATPFVVPWGTPALFLITTASDVTVRIDVDAAVPSTLTAIANDFALAANQGLSLPCKVNSNAASYIAALSTAGATIKVYAVWGF